MQTEQIQVNTQSSIRIEGSKVLRIDPFQVAQETHDADIILITHEHFDHLDPDSIRNVRKEGTVFVGPASIENKLKAAAGEDSVLHLVRPGDSLEMEGIRILAVPAYNRLKPFHLKKYQWVGYCVEMDGICYYAAGDTDAVPELQEIKCDIAMVPIGGHYTMGVKEAAGLINRIRPETAIPIHYGSVVGKKEDADVFATHVDDGIEVVYKLF